MSLEWIRISLRGWKPDAIVGRELFDLLNITPQEHLEIREGTDVGEASAITLVDAQIAPPTSPTDEPSEIFAETVRQGLERAARWIATRPEGAFDRCRNSGMNLDIFIGGWIDQDQMDLSLPPAFLHACGTAGLEISIITND